VNAEIVAVTQLGGGSDMETSDSESYAGQLLVEVRDPQRRGDGEEASKNASYYIRASQLLLALPPAKAAESIRFSENIAHLGGDDGDKPDLLQRMCRQPVWMGSVAKIVLYYEEKFWNSREMFGGLPMHFGSGSGRSSMEDLCAGLQVYDAGEVSAAAMAALQERTASGETAAQRTEDGGVEVLFRDGVSADKSNKPLHALVAFVAVGSEKPRADTARMLAEVVASQLAQLSRGDSGSFDNWKAVALKNWRADPFVTSKGTRRLNMPAHPQAIPGLNEICRNIWFANSEASPEDTGMLPGAVRQGKWAAEQAMLNFVGVAGMSLGGKGDMGLQG